jgi:citrate lyase subunit beta / citryl-CoA lyase
VDESFAVLRETKGYRRECTRAKTLGTPFRWAIHPSQIEMANEVFSPMQGEVDRALKLTKAYEEAEDKGLGAVENDGDPIDAALVRSLRNTMQNIHPVGV